jgi:hypothetical protein
LVVAVVAVGHVVGGLTTVAERMRRVSLTVAVEVRVPGADGLHAGIIAVAVAAVGDPVRIGFAAHTLLVGVSVAVAVRVRVQDHPIHGVFVDLVLAVRVDAGTALDGQWGALGVRIIAVGVDREAIPVEVVIVAGGITVIVDAIVGDLLGVRRDGWISIVAVRAGVDTVSIQIVQTVGPSIFIPVGEAVE